MWSSTSGLRCLGTSRGTKPEQRRRRDLGRRVLFPARLRDQRRVVRLAGVVGARQPPTFEPFVHCGAGNSANGSRCAGATDGMDGRH